MSGEMAFAYFLSHAPHGFFPILNRGDGAILYCFMFLYIAFAGAGPWSLDALLEPQARLERRGAGLPERPGAVESSCARSVRRTARDEPEPSSNRAPRPSRTTQRPPLWKVILLNDDFTPREFVVQVLKAVFRMNESQAYRVMMTAHQKGACVIAVYTKDVADTKAKEATEMGKAKGYPLYFTTEKEE